MGQQHKVLISGGTGSFAKALVNKLLLDDNYSEIRIFSRDEKKQEDMRIKYSNPKLRFIIGDVRDVESIQLAIQGVDLVFHAAALKQVPSCEFYPIEAYKTNVLGTSNMIDACIANNVKKMVFLSTDKAVYPINAMGISKAMAEKVLISKARMHKDSSTVLCITRYGNVLASRGSVVPLFISQIKQGQSLSITDPNMTRFIMTLDDSVELVLHAFEHAQQGSIYVQKSPASTIATLAEAVSDIFNYDPSNIRNIGTRHGEKLFETLVSREELTRASESDKYYCIPCDGRDLNYGLYFSEGSETITINDDYTSHNTVRLECSEVREILMELECIKEQIND